MTKLFFAIVGLILIIYGALYIMTPESSPADNPTPTASSTPTAVVSDEATVIADNLDIPWDIAFLPDNTLLVTERPGHVLHIDPATGSRTEIPVTVGARGEGGLLGIVLHPQFATNHYVYLYLSSGGTGETKNKIDRYTYVNDTLTLDREIIGNIPGATYHDGGRMEFGPDGKLYVTTGDATSAKIAQDLKSLGGKTLRLNDDGTIPSDNPFGTAVYSLGHRNPQGLAWDRDGNLWQTEHGPTGEGGRCCHDEINKIVKGGNYGWPSIIGDETKAGLLTPARHSADGTWAPASLVYLDGALYFGGLKGEAIYRATITDGVITTLDTFWKGTYGRIRTIRIGPDNMFYITTSNTDGRGSAKSGDDKIIRVAPSQLR